MKPIYKHHNIAAIHGFKDYLEGKGIGTSVRNENAFVMGAEFGISNTYIELWLLNDADFDVAEKLILEFEQLGENGEEWVCNHCNEQNGPSFEVCWHCGEAQALDA